MEYGLFKKPALEQSAAEVAVDIGGIGFEGERLVEVSYGFVHVSLGKEQSAEVVMGNAGGWVPFYCRGPQCFEVRVGKGFPPGQHTQRQHHRPA